MKSFKLFIFIAITLAVASAVIAQEPTDNADTLRDSVKQQVEEELSQIQKAVSVKAFLGSISSKNEAEINLTSYQNQPRKALVTTDTTIRLKNGRDGTPKDLTVGDYLLVMGEVDSQNVMTAKRLLVVPTPEEDTRTINYGRVTEVTSSSISIDTLDKKTVTAKLMSSTLVNRTDTGASVKVKITDIETGDLVVMITRSGTSVTVLNLQIVATPAPTDTPVPTDTPTPNASNTEE